MEPKEKDIDEMSLEELEAELAKCPKEILDKVDEIMRAFGIALGEATANWCERVMNGEDVPFFVDDEKDR